MSVLGWVRERVGARQAWARVPLDEVRFTVLDTELTGLDDLKDDIVSIGNTTLGVDTLLGEQQSAQESHEQQGHLEEQPGSVDSDSIARGKLAQPECLAGVQVRRHGQVAARLGHFVAILLADLFERRDVGLVELGDVRDGVPRVAQVLGRLPPDVGHRLDLDVAGIGVQFTAQEREQAALAGAVRTGDADLLPGEEREVDAVEQALVAALQDDLAQRDHLIEKTEEGATGRREEVIAQDAAIATRRSLGWLMGLEPTTTGITIQDSTN